MGKILGNEELNNLPTKVNYSYFDEKRGDCYNVDIYKSTEVRLNMNDGLQEVSDKIMKALCYVYNKSKDPKFDKSICDFLYYWISDMLLKHLTNSSSYNTAISPLFDVFHHTGVNNVCKVRHWSMEAHNFNDIKLIFDYSKDYNIYKEQLTEQNPQCYEDYMNYLNKYVSTYNKLYDECQKEENLTKKHCELFKEYFTHEQHSHLSTLKCDLKENETQPEQLSGGHGNVAGDTQLTVIHVEREESATGPHHLSQPYSSKGTSEMGGIKMNGKDTPTSIASPTVIGMTTIAGIVVPSYLTYNVISIWIKKLNVILYI
ncbi:hypothetical protein PVIIG_06234 [Plasmodium vivax India VII]|uniref:Variable surface protein Vir7-like protein n=1 Tax=Plasmodium vivax India VII TaxID=1077284 RepID=A0A0J9UUL7_PLAVI|nr:hypothetical protein PVIIG_06234 [Plasmodium vivax India VII]